MTAADLPPTKWTIRRGFMFAVCVFCALVIGYITWFDLSSLAALTSLIAAYTLIAGCVGSYVFGVAWEDIARIKVIGGGK
jgi:hypothetical protein